PRSRVPSRAAVAGGALARADAPDRAAAPLDAPRPRTPPASRRHGGRGDAATAAATAPASRRRPGRARRPRAAVPPPAQRPRRMSDFDADVIVIGSGPAGVSAALPLVETGRRVLMIDGDDDARAEAAAPWQRMLGDRLEALVPDDGLSPKLRAPEAR